MKILPASSKFASSRCIFPVVVLALLLACAACNKSAQTTEKARAAGPSVIPVSVTTAEKRDMPVFLTGLGNVTAQYTVNLKSRVDGQIMRVNFTEGQEVRKGQLLVVIDPRPYQVALAQAKATLFRDQTQLTIARRQLERYQQLFKEGVISREQLDTQESTTGALEGTVKADQAAVDNAQLNVTYCRITSPIDGRVGLRQVDPGNMVHASDQNGMLVINQLHPITVIFTLPEDTLRTISHHTGKGPLPVEIYSRDDQTKLADGKLLTLDNQIDQTTGTVRLKAIVPNEKNQLWPNQFVNVRLRLDTQKNATVVPLAAVQRGSQGTYAFLLKSDQTVQLQPITVGITSGNMVTIEAGLNPGDQVVTDGQDKLQNGSKVHPTQGGRGSSTTSSTQNVNQTAQIPNPGAAAQ